MLDLEPSFSQDPGEPPRSISWRKLYGLLPGNLQITVFVLPPTLILSLLWWVLKPDKNSFGAFATLIVVTPIYLLMIVRRRRRIVEGEKILGVVTNIGRGDGPFSGAYNISYCYQIQDIQHKDDHLIATRIHLKIGDTIWLLVDPDNPSDSVPWI